MNRAKFDEIIAKLQECVNVYKRRKGSNYSYNLILSDSTTLRYNFNEKYIPHLLGVNIEYLKSNNLCRKETAFEILEEFLNNSFNIFNKLAENGGGGY